MADAPHYDQLETRSADEREKALAAALPAQIAHAKANAPFFADWLKDVDPAAVNSRAALAKLPVLRKSNLGAVQKRNPPMGGLLAVPLSQALQEYPEQIGPYNEIHRLLGAPAPRFTVQMWARLGYAPVIGPSPRRGLAAHILKA